MMKSLPILLGGLLFLAAGCSSSDPLDKAAAPTTSTTNQPPKVPGKTIHKMPPLVGPNAGKGGPGGV